MQRTTRKTLKQSMKPVGKKKEKRAIWSNALTAKTDPDEAFSAIMNLVRTRCPFPLALYKRAKESQKMTHEYKQILRSYGYCIPFYFTSVGTPVFGVNPDIDAITNIATCEQAIHATGKTPPLGISYELN